MVKIHTTLQDYYYKHYFNYPVYKSACINRKTYNATVGKLAPGCVWKANVPDDVTYENYMKMECKDCEKEGLLQLTNTIMPNPVICYHQCKGNLYNALKRQALYVQKPEPDFVEKFNEWSFNIWDSEIRPILEDFKYSYARWFNGLTRSQQLEILPYHNKEKEVPLANTFNMFCKLEKQEVTIKNGEWDWPKNRCICAPEPYIKYVTGPVISALQELYAANNVKGYCVDKNWDDLGTFYNKCMKKGLYMTIQGDISGLDRSVTDFLLGINRLSYKFIKKKIYHCDDKAWDCFLMNNTTKIVSKMFKKDKMKFKGIQDIVNLGNVWVEGTRKSGEYPTTHGNTELVSRLIRYVMEIVLNIHRDNYELLVKGDDFVIFTVPDNHEIYKNAFKQVFETRGINPDGKCVYKSGTALKFLKFGTIYDTDFCSTDTFYCKDCKTHRVTRKLNRYFTLTPFTRNVFGCSEKEIDNYMNAMYTADLKWSSNLELFNCYGEKLNKKKHNIKVKNGKQKMEIPLEPGFTNKVDKDDMDKCRAELGLLNINKSNLRDIYQSWRNHPKDRPKKCCDKWHKYICTKKYGWTLEEIDTIIKGIREETDVSGLLQKGFDYNDKYYTADYEFYYDQ